MNPEGSLQAVWMLPCATCLSSFSSVVLNISVPQSNRLMLLTDRLTLFDVESIDLLKSKSVSPSINWFFCLKDPEVGLSPHIQMEGNQAGFMFPLSWGLH